jgi:hypothetical protein
MPGEITPAERYLRQKIERQKQPRTPEAAEPRELELESLNQAIEILNSLSEDAFMRRPAATEKLDHAIMYLKRLRDRPATEAASE